MGGGGRVGDDTSSVSQIGSYRNHPELVDELLSPCDTALNRQSNDAATLAHLFEGQFILRVRFQEEITQRFQIRATFKVSGDLQGIVAMPVHSYRQGFHAF